MLCPNRALLEALQKVQRLKAEELAAANGAASSRPCSPNPHSSVPAWRIPWTEKPGRLQSIASHGVGHDWSDLALIHQVSLWISHSSHHEEKKLCLLETQVFGCGGEENELKQTELEGAWDDRISQNPGGETDGALRRGHWKKLDWRIVYRGVAGFKAAPQRSGSAQGLITPARTGGCRCCWNPGWQLSRKGPRGEKNLTSLSSLPSTSCQDSPLAPLSWKPEDKGAWWYHPFRSASEQASKQDSGGGWRGDWGMSSTTCFWKYIS